MTRHRPRADRDRRRAARAPSARFSVRVHDVVATRRRDRDGDEPDRGSDRPGWTGHRTGRAPRARKPSAALAVGARGGRRAGVREQLPRTVRPRRLPSITHNPSIAIALAARSGSARRRDRDVGPSRPQLHAALSTTRWAASSVTGYHALNLADSSGGRTGALRRRAPDADVRSPARAVRRRRGAAGLRRRARLDRAPADDRRRRPTSSSAARASRACSCLLTLYCAIRGWTWGAAIACALGMGTKGVDGPRARARRPAGITSSARRGAALALLWRHSRRRLIVLFVPMLSETQGRIGGAADAGLHRRGAGRRVDAVVLSLDAGRRHHALPRRSCSGRGRSRSTTTTGRRRARPFDVLPQALLMSALVRAHRRSRSCGSGRPGSPAPCSFWCWRRRRACSRSRREVAAEHRMHLPLRRGDRADLHRRCFALVRSPADARRIVVGAILLMADRSSCSRGREPRRACGTWTTPAAAALWGDAVRQASRQCAGADLLRPRADVAVEPARRRRDADARRLPLKMDRSMRGAASHLQLGSAVAAAGTARRSDRSPRTRACDMSLASHRSS